MTAPINGIFNTGNLLTDQASKSFAAQILRLFPNGQSPLFALSGMLDTKTALQIQHGYYTKTMIFPSATLNGAINSGAVAAGTAENWTVASTANILAGMVLRVTSTGENILVTTVTNSTTLAVQRGMGTIAAGNIADAVVLYQVGNAFEEASTRPSAMALTPVYNSNLTQIFRNSWALSGTTSAVQMAVGGSQVAESRQDCMAFHAADIEKALIFGQKYSGTKNSQPLHMMNGLLASVTDATYGAPGNITTAGATTTFTQLETALDPCFNVQTDPKIANHRLLFVGGTALKVLNNIGKLSGTYQIIDGQTSFGLQFSTFKIARGTFTMIEHPLLNSNTTWAKMAIAVDLSSFKLAYLNGRKTSSQEYGTNGTPVDSGVDAVGGTLTSELTCEIINPAANGIIWNLTAAA